MTPRDTTLEVAPEEAGLRLDRVLTRHLPEMNRAKVRHLFDTERIRVNGALPSGPAMKLAPGDRLLVAAMERGDRSAHLLFDESAFFVAYKPGGAPTARALLASEREGRRGPRPRAVFSLERAVSGALVGSRAAGVRHQLVRQFEAGRASRRFTALLRGVTPRPAGPLPDVPGWTYRVLERYRDHVLVLLMPPAGIVAEPLQALSTAGWPVAPLSGPPGPAAAVHAGSLVFAHPRTGRPLRFSPPLPERFADLLRSLSPAPTLAAAVPPEPPGGQRESAPQDGPEPALRSPRSIIQSRYLKRHDGDDG